MKTYTVFGYDLPEGASVIEETIAADPTQAAIDVGKARNLEDHEWEIVAVVEGKVNFCQVDYTTVNAAPISPT